MLLLMEQEMIRLSKLMTERGLCSRREADVYIEAGQVLVDGQVVSTLGTKVTLNAKIELTHQAKKAQQSKVTIVLNKPLGYVSTQPEKGYPSAIDLVIPKNQIRIEGDRPLQPSHLKKLAVAGRLDIDSKGLLVMTQDGAIVKKLIGPGSEIEKEYIVRVDGEITEDMLRRLRYGLWLDDVKLKPAKVDLMPPDVLRFILIEGKKRQIRRMCEIVGLYVAKLKRVRVGRVRLGDLPEGHWRYLKPHERF